MNVWFLFQLLMALSHIAIGVYASIKFVGRIEEPVPVSMKTPTKRRSPKLGAFPEAEPDASSQIYLPRPRRAWQTIEDDKSLSDSNPVATSSNSASNFQTDKVTQFDQDAFKCLQDRSGIDEDKAKYEGGESADSYKNLKREEGAGPLRLGKSVALGKDSYSVLFASCFQADLVLYYETNHAKDGANPGK